MAKLKARGRTELYRVELKRDVAGYKDYKTTLALMSDGVVLTKRSYKVESFTGDVSNQKWETRSTRWTVYDNLARGFTSEGWLAAKLEKGWVRV